MPHLNIEIKASCPDVDAIRTILTEKQARLVGLDHQIDTYFKVPNGRLKLREGNIENHLIHYHRPNQAGPKRSEVTLLKNKPGSTLKKILTDAMGILTIVDKKREIYFIENVKFHIDQVNGLGEFIEIEAIDENGTIGEAELFRQCTFYMELFAIKEEHLLQHSYSDMLIGQS